MSSPTPVALVDDHTLFRKALVGLVNGMGDYCVVLEAGNGREFKQGISAGPLVELAVVDLHMPVMNGYETLEWIRDNCPEVRALALTFDGSEDTVTKALRAGARGFLRKDVGPDEFRLALDQVRTAGCYHTDLVRHNLARHADGRTSREREQARLQGMLTPREREFLRWLASTEELSYDDIATRMGVNVRTVHSFRDDVCDKLEVHSKTGLVLMAIRSGLVEI